MATEVKDENGLSLVEDHMRRMIREETIQSATFVLDAFIKAGSFKASSSAVDTAGHSSDKSCLNDLGPSDTRGHL
jgi:hypothetical protein